MFWTYVVAALNTAAHAVGASSLSLLQSPQPLSLLQSPQPPTEAVASGPPAADIRPEPAERLTVDAVTGQDSGKAMPEARDRGNLFVVPLDDRRDTRASDWYEQNDERSEAIHHALAAEDFERAVVKGFKPSTSTSVPPVSMREAVLVA